jgi:multiple antibiotic resistance protein
MEPCGMTIGVLDILMILLITAGPLRAVPAMAALTRHADAPQRAAVAFSAVRTAAIVLLVFILLGQAILHSFHVTIAALKLAGGVILLIYALSAIGGGDAPPHAPDGPPPPHIATSPLAMPLLASPQSIVAVIVIAAAGRGLPDLLVLIAVVLGLMAINWLALRHAERILTALGPGLLVVQRVVALLLTGLAVQLAISGLADLGVVERMAA